MWFFAYRMEHAALRLTLVTEWRRIKPPANEMSCRNDNCVAFCLMARCLTRNFGCLCKIVFVNITSIQRQALVESSLKAGYWELLCDNWAAI